MWHRSQHRLQMLRIRLTHWKALRRRTRSHPTRSHPRLSRTNDAIQCKTLTQERGGSYPSEGAARETLTSATRAPPGRGGSRPCRGNARTPTRGSSRDTPGKGVRMSQQAATRRANPMVGWGLGLGAIAGVLSALTTLGRLFAPLGGARAFTGIGLLVGLIGLIAYFLAGMLTARVTGTIGTGTIAGLLAGLAAAVISVAVSAVVILTRPRLYFGSALGALSSSRVHIPLSTLVALSMISLVFSILVDIGLGAGIGALGALVGRGSAPRQPYQETLYQGMPGAYPPPPGGYAPAPGAYPPPAGGYPPPPGSYPPPPGSYPPPPGSYPPSSVPSAYPPTSVATPPSTAPADATPPPEAHQG